MNALFFLDLVWFVLATGLALQGDQDGKTTMQIMEAFGIKMLRAVSEFGKRTIDNATICIRCYKHLHIRMCLLRLLDVKISVSFLMVLNFGSKFAFASHDREKPWSTLYLGLFCVT